MTDIVNWLWFGALLIGGILIAIRNPVKSLLRDLQTLVFAIFVIGFVIRIIIGVISDS